MVENGSLVVLPLTNVAELRQGKFYLEARKRYLGIAESEIVGYMQGMTIVVVSMMACSRWGLEEGDHHKYPGRAKVPVEALASLAAGDCSIAAAVAGVVEPAAAGVAEAQELGDFVAGHHCHQTLVWEMEEG